LRETLPCELVSYIFRHVLDARPQIEIREDLLLDQPDAFVRSLLTVPRDLLINH
jgi:hypothetical protein